ncbi:hypothetical protein XELAEV_18042017mg [Xenopus laevis]|uniref:Uncharacterized protein n=1 Tax=Xenopus laevis TaxID=8355 RepID=A0A974C3F2_XENLA|nr:hypothetical protein XELAEV_18042017mg [Xenopus laevis]
MGMERATCILDQRHRLDVYNSSKQHGLLIFMPGLLLKSGLHFQWSGTNCSLFNTEYSTIQKAEASSTYCVLGACMHGRFCVTLLKICNVTGS